MKIQRGGEPAARGTGQQQGPEREGERRRYSGKALAGPLLEGSGRTSDREPHSSQKEALLSRSLVYSSARQRSRLASHLSSRSVPAPGTLVCYPVTSIVPSRIAIPHVWLSQFLKHYSAIGLGLPITLSWKHK